MSTTSPSTFPPEIVYCILEECRTEIPLLKRCTFVSPSWSSIARQFLFESVTISNDHVEQDIASFIRFIRSDPCIPPVIKKVTVNHGKATVFELLQAVSHFPGLNPREVVLLDLALSPSPPSNQPPDLPTSTPKSLSTLSITDCIIEGTAPQWAVLFELLTSFTAIETIILKDMCTGPTDPELTAAQFISSPPVSCSFSFPPPSERTVVRNLLVSPDTGPHVDGLATGLVRSLDTDEIEELELDVWEGEGLELSQTLVSASRGVVNLRLRLDEWLKERIPRFSLSTCIFLDYVSFYIRLKGPKPSSNVRLIQNNISCSLATISSIPIPAEGTWSGDTNDGSLMGWPLKVVKYRIWLIDDLFKSDRAVDFIARCVSWDRIGKLLKLFPRFRKLKVTFFTHRRPGSGETVIPVDYLKSQLDENGLTGRHVIKVKYL